MCQDLGRYSTRNALFIVVFSSVWSFLPCAHSSDQLDAGNDTGNGESLCFVESQA